MRKIFVLIFILSFLLAACKQSKPSADVENENTELVEVVDSVKTEVEDSVVYDVIDAQTFGLMGKVESVKTQSFLTNDNNGTLEEGSMVTESEMTFDQWGHVTEDEWGNEYGYDAEGNYYRGNHTYTVLKRDKSGRLKEYVDEEPNADNQDNQKIAFDYDKTGRLAIVTQGGWTGHWQEQRAYEGGNLYPSSIVTIADYEGGGTSHVTKTYRYTRYDEKKNWIERICVISAADIEESFDSVAIDTKIEEQIRIEKRIITYYE